MTFTIPSLELPVVFVAAMVVHVVGRSVSWDEQDRSHSSDGTAHQTLVKNTSHKIPKQFLRQYDPKKPLTSTRAHGTLMQFQVGLSLRLIYLFNSCMLNHNSRLNIIIYLFILQFIMVVSVITRVVGVNHRGLSQGTIVHSCHQGCQQVITIVIKVINRLSPNQSSQNSLHGHERLSDK